MMHVLDGAMMTDRPSLHAYLAQHLPLPDYYGANLDALYDALTDMEACEIVLQHTDDMVLHLGEYAWRVIHTFADAQQANPKLSFRIEK